MMDKFEPKSVARVEAGTKSRLAVVIRVESDRIWVAYVTGTARDLPRVEVKENTQFAKAIGLSKTSYFYRDHTAFVLLAEANLVAGRRCPPELFASLRVLLEIEEPA